MEKFSNLSTEESRILLKKFFIKIIDLKEQEQKLKLDNNELEIQIEEHSKVIDQLKSALRQNVSVSSSSDTKLVEQKTRNEKIIKMLQQQLSDSTSRVALLEREIESYKEKILKLKQKYQEQNLESDSLVSILNSHIHRENSSSIAAISNAADLKSSFKPVKISRKDLRPLTQEELIKRSLSRQQQQQQHQSNDNSIDENF